MMEPKQVEREKKEEILVNKITERIMDKKYWEKVHTALTIVNSPTAHSKELDDAAEQVLIDFLKN